MVEQLTQSEGVAAPGAQKVPVYGQLLEQVAGPVPSERAS
jgi:hypothetical protein